MTDDLFFRKVIESIASLPAEIYEYHYHAHAFGSWYVVFRFKGYLFRLIFDGKDSAYILERSTTSKAPYSWKPTGWQIVRPNIESFSFEELIAVLRQEIERS